MAPILVIRAAEKVFLDREPLLFVVGQPIPKAIKLQHSFSVITGRWR
jgi:hypothetical protein